MRHQASEIPFVSLMHHFLKQFSTNVSVDQLTECYQLVLECNPWFPEEGTLDKQVWQHVQNNVLTAYRQDAQIPRLWLVTQALVQTVIKQPDGKRVDVEVETVQS